MTRLVADSVFKRIFDLFEPPTAERVVRDHISGVDSLRIGSAPTGLVMEEDEDDFEEDEDEFEDDEDEFEDDDFDEDEDDDDFDEEDDEDEDFDEEE